MLCLLVAKPVSAEVVNQNSNGITAAVIFDNKWPNFDDAPIAADATYSLSMVSSPMIGLAKTLTGFSLQSNGTYSITYTFKVQNYGDVDLNNIQVTDDLSATLPSPITFVKSNLTTSNVTSGSALTVNAGFNGSTNKNLLNPASSNLKVGASGTITLTISVVVNSNYGTFNNTATAMGITTDGSATTVTDVSDNNVSPNEGDNTKTPLDFSTPTPVTFAPPDIQVTKTVDHPIANVGSNVVFTIAVKNVGAGGGAPLVLHDLLPAGFQYVSHSSVPVGYNTTTGNWSPIVGSGVTRTLTITAKVLPNHTLAEYTNTATVTATDDTDLSNNSSSATVTPLITLSPASLPNVSSPLSYTQTISASGTTAPYSFAVSSGALPAGITLAPNGTLSGTATQLGTFNFTITATDANAITGSRDYTLTVNAPILTLSPATFPAATVGALYSQTLSTSRNIVIGGETYTYAITAGTLPAGLSLTSAGFLSGTPTAGGTFNFTITSTDNATGAGPYTGSQAYTLTVGAPTIIINPAAQAMSASSVAPISYTQTASGGTSPYTFSITIGSLPAGITMASDGSFSGTATVLGAFNFTVRATDSSTGTGPYTQDISRTITVSGPTITVLPVSVAALPAAKAGVPYSATFTASGTGSTGPFTFTKSAGNLPAGLTLATDGTLSGTPTAVGTSTFGIRATDSSPSPGPYTGTKTYISFAVSAPTIVVGPTNLPNGVAGMAYSQNIIATGGTAPYAYAVTAGTLPAGITLTSDGTLSGTSNVTGTFNFNVTATDATTGGAGFPYSGSTAYTLTFSAPTISLVPTTLPVATVGAAYSQTVTASGGTAAYTYTLTAGALPTGLTLSSTTGTITGTATAGGTFNLTVTATDALLFTGSQAYTLSTNVATLVLVPATLPAGTVGAAYSQVITASGGTTPYAYALTAGALPAGVTLTANGTLSGTSTVAGTFNFTVTATDASGGTGPYTASAAYSIVIGKANQTITFADITATYGDAPVALTGTASSGLGVTYTSSNPSVATVTGSTLTIVGAGTATITASQAGNATYNAAINLTKTLIINAKAITIKIDTKTKVYGTSDPVFTYQVTSGSLAGTDSFTGSSTRDAGEAVNTYAIKQGTLALNGNYTLTYIGANLIITQANLMVKANDQTKAYGTVNPDFTVSYTGFVNGDTEASLTTKPIVSTTATANSAMGTYPLIVTGVVSPNYMISYGPGTLTITKAILTVTANNILTPNGDGKNDFWIVKDIQLYPKNSVTVYDTGGRQVFTKKDYNNDWGGTLNDTGSPLAGGTYYYIVDLGIGGNMIKGYISIIRSK